MDLDLASYIESVRLVLYYGLPGDTWETVLRRRRDGRKKNCAFWRAMAIVRQEGNGRVVESFTPPSFRRSILFNDAVSPYFLLCR